ncbi:MAG: hypothetical protein M3081_02310 [Gemmatimonadota bacterium]|nr:hypothetical protein [Gemmatimonadota bacterium]
MTVKHTHRANALLVVLLAACHGASGPTQPPPLSGPAISGGVLDWSGGMSSSLNARAFTLGDTIHIDATAHSAAGLAWFGVIFGGSERDSIPMRDTVATVRIDIAVRNTPLGPLTIGLFARDLTGHLAEVSPAGASEIWLYPTSTPAATVVAHSPIVDGLFDNARGLLYEADYGGRVLHAFSLATQADVESATLPHVTESVDASASGDTVIVGYSDSPMIGIIDTRVHPWHIDSLTVQVGTLSAAVKHVAVLSNGTALLYVSCSCTGSGRLVSVNPFTGQQRVRSDLVPATTPLVVTRLTRTPERGIVYVSRAEASGGGNVYELGSDAFTLAYAVPDAASKITSAARNGTIALGGGYQFDRSMRVLRNLSPPFFQPALRTPRIATSGAYALYPTDRGLVRVRLSDGRPVERLSLSQVPRGVAIGLDERTILAFNDNSVTITSVGAPLVAQSIAQQAMIWRAR